MELCCYCNYGNLFDEIKHKYPKIILLYEPINNKKYQELIKFI